MHEKLPFFGLEKVFKTNFFYFFELESLNLNCNKREASGLELSKHGTHPI